MSREKVFCQNCEEDQTTRFEEREQTFAVRDRKITVPVGVNVCTVCGGTIGSDEEDQEILDAVHAEYRRQTDLLTSDRIKAIRQRYRLSQKSFAALLGMSEATINRYEQGALQDGSHDTAIRACENPGVMRDILERRGHLLSVWQLDRAKSALAGNDDETVLERIGEVDWICMPREITDRTGFRRFEYPRFAAVVLWFCKQLGETSLTVINKLLFYADLLNFKSSTVSLTGAAYRRAPYGPVPADYDGLLSRMESEGLVIREEREFGGGYTGYYFKSGPKAGDVSATFTPYETRVLECVAHSLGKLTAKAISEKSHREPAWVETEDGKLISYDLAKRLSLPAPS